MVRRFARAMLIASLGVASVVVGVAYRLDRRTGPHAPAGTFDAIVVLGCRVNPGGIPSAALERRARHAARLYHQGKAALVIVTGGVGDHGPSEASVAARILEHDGVPREAILVEDASTSTWENARYARERFGAGRVLVVTDAFHTMRSEKIFDGVFGDATAVGSRSPWLWPRVSGAVREVAAVAIYAALGRIDLFSSAPRGACRPPAPGSRLAVLPPGFRDAALPERARFYARLAEAKSPAALTISAPNLLS